MVFDPETGWVELRRRPKEFSPEITKELQWAREWKSSMGDWFDTDVMMVRGPDLKRLFELVDELAK